MRQEVAQDYTSYKPSWKNFGTEMSIKFESEERGEEISITGDYCSKSGSKEEDRGKGKVVWVA